MDNLIDPIIVLETALFAAQEPLTEKQLAQLFDGSVSRNQLKKYLNKLKVQWDTRGLKLKELASGWRFCTRQALMPYLNKLNDEQYPRYSRAVMETLAIIVYKQPVTRGDIEIIRGVSVSTQIIQTLLDRAWIKESGRKEVPGRPRLYVTSTLFLDDMGLQSLDELPPLTELDTLVIANLLSQQ